MPDFLESVKMKKTFAHLTWVRSTLGGGFKHFFIFTPIPGKMIPFDEHIFQMGWFNHQLEVASPSLQVHSLQR